MCKSVAEGGQRCAAHTKGPARKAMAHMQESGASSLSSTELDAIAAYASTPTGQKEIQSLLPDYLARGDFEATSALATALRDGANLRAANADVRASLEKTGQSSETVPDLSWRQRQALYTSIVAADMNLTEERVSRIFRGLMAHATKKYGLKGREAGRYARKRIYEAAEKEYRRLAAASNGGWGTWQWEREWDEETRTWSVKPLKPQGEPPGKDWRDEYSAQAVREGKPVRVRMGKDENSGEGYLFTPDGRRIWGLYGAAGVLFRAPKEGGGYEYFVARRSTAISGGGGKWAFPGGAKDRTETDSQAAFREFAEEIGVLPIGAKVAGEHTDDVIPGEWAYTTVVVDVPSRFAVPKRGGDGETMGTAWVSETALHRGAKSGKLHSSFAKALKNVLAVSSE